MKVRKEKVQNALQWLIENNPHYAGVDINLEALNSLPENGVPTDILTADTDSEVSLTRMLSLTRAQDHEV